MIPSVPKSIFFLIQMTLNYKHLHCIYITCTSIIDQQQLLLKKKKKTERSTKENYIKKEKLKK